MSEMTEKIHEENREGSFKRDQQLKASSIQDSRQLKMAPIHYQVVLASQVYFFRYIIIMPYENLALLEVRVQCIGSKSCSGIYE